jgi:hypothetical protein
VQVKTRTKKKIMNEKEHQEIKTILSAGRARFVDPFDPHSDFRKFERFAKHPEVSKDLDLSLLIVMAYPELISNLNLELRGNGLFMLEAFNRKNSTYLHASEEIKQYCGSAPYEGGLAILESALVSLGFPSSDEQYAEIGLKLKTFAVAQEARQALGQSLSAAAPPHESKPRRTHKI